MESLRKELEELGSVLVHSEAICQFPAIAAVVTYHTMAHSCCYCLALALVFKGIGMYWPHNSPHATHYTASQKDEDL